MRLEQPCQIRSETPRLTRAQRSNCLIKHRAFIQELIDDDNLGSLLEIKYFAEPGLTTSVDLKKNLINMSRIILKLAFSRFGELRAYGGTFENGEAEWEEIEVTSSYWQ